MVQSPVLREYCKLFRVAKTRRVWRLSKASGEIARKIARSTWGVAGRLGPRGTVGVQNYWSWAPKQAKASDAGEPSGKERGMVTPIITQITSRFTRQSLLRLARVPQFL